MRTTLDIDEDVLAAAKERAAGQKTTTGKVISQLPREQLLKMRDAPDYRPGTIVDSRS